MYKWVIFHYHPSGSDESDAEEGGQARWSNPVPQAPVVTQPVKDEGARPKLILPQRLFLSEPFALPKAPTDYSLELGKINGLVSCSW